MRLKLILIVSLLAAIVGTGTSVIIIITLDSFVRPMGPFFSNRSHGWLGFVQLVPALVAAFLAGMFVYRHTARRRKFQGAATIVLVLILSIAAQITLLLLNY